MRTWFDEEVGHKWCEPDCADEWLRLIWQVALDYDGYHTAEDLKSLIDELVEMSQKARECLHNGQLFTEES